MPNSLDGATVDVIVVGFGGSGAVAALAAAEAGATVAIVEKSARGGGNTQEAGGSLRKIADADAAVRYFGQLANGGTPIDMIEAFVAGCNQAIEWLERRGLHMTEAGGPWQDWKYPLVTHDPFPRVPGNEGLGGRVRVQQDLPGHGGSALWEGLHRGVLDAGIDVVLDSRVVGLLRERKSGRTSGVTVVSVAGTTSQLTARRGVVLACGGFSGDAGMQRAYLGMELPAFGLPGGNAGDGVRLAQAAGAELWHMNAFAAVLGYRIEGYPSAFRHHVCNESFIYVDQAAARFVNEVGLDNHAMPWAFRWMDPALPGYPRIPGYLIFDESARRAGPVVKDALGYHRRDWQWSADNSREIDKGWIHGGETVDELAASLGISAPALVRTVAEYNAGASAGVDHAFGRPADAMVALQPPYYGIALWPCLLNTQGGPRRNASGQVIGIDGSPIPGLFSAGELGSIWTELYPGGGNLMECIVSGIVAGRAAAEGGDRD
jgi:succinate dehydrogenase/fumarate reductase flavoprotein subunit